MDKKELLEGLEKENFVEINNENVTINELLKCKISKKALAIESYLHKIYNHPCFQVRFQGFRRPLQELPAAFQGRIRQGFQAVLRFR